MKKCAKGEGFGHGDMIPARKGPAAIVMVMVPEVYNRPYQAVPRRRGILFQSGVRDSSPENTDKREYQDGIPA